MPNITKRGDTYRIRVSNGRDASGKQIIETATFHPDPERTEKQNQKALQQFALDFERKVKSGNYLEGEKITFAEFVEKWRKLYAKEQLQETTVEFYDFLELDPVPDQDVFSYVVRNAKLGRGDKYERDIPVSYQRIDGMYHSAIYPDIV